MSGYSDTNYNYNAYGEYSWDEWDMGMNYFDYYDMTQYNTYLASPTDLDQFPLESQPLSRYSSSGGSSYQSAVPSSPETDYIPYGNDTADPFLFDQNMPSPAFLDTGSPPMYMGHHLETPRTVPTSAGRPRATSSSSSSSSSAGYACPSCPSKPPFKRRADLNRHITHMHKPATLSSYPCDYPRCARRHDPFHRRDHFRDHLREFHREDIEKRGVSVDETWYEDRNTVTSWWRCNRCLRRVSVDKHGFECPLCKAMCCAKRQEVRRR